MCFMTCEEFHNARFGPVARISCVARNEGAMASVFGRYDSDLRVVR
jgi:hypothetical protein